MDVAAGATEPFTATGSDPRNVDGQAIAITVFSSVRWPGQLWLAVLFRGATLVSKVERARNRPGTLAKLSFIHFARWTLVRRIPYNGEPQQREKLSYPRLFFESNFNGGWEEYIDAFSHILTKGMTFFWGSSYGFPKPLPTAPFKQYIKNNELVASHFYSAYPQATTTMVLAAIDLQQKLEKLKQQTSGATPEAFAETWRAFLSDVQGSL
jgi:hypothetical protein